MSIYDTDIVVISDFRLPGGTSHSLAKEISTQAEAGYRTSLVHAPSRLVGGVLPWSPSIMSVLDLPNVSVASPRAALHAQLIIARHPTVIESTSETFPNITADRVLMVANNAALDGSGQPFYDVAAIDGKLRRLFGVSPIWAPIGPVVRHSIAAQNPDVSVTDEDWFNLMAPEAIGAPREGYVAEVPVIGRHSRPQPAKWPDTAEEILHAYPDSDDFRVEILGGADVVAKVVGQVPDRWQVIPFGEEDPVRFLQRIDFWVYFHHPDWREAYGRAVMEALASGAVVLLPSYLRETYGDAALYCAPAEVEDLVTEYGADLDRFLDQSARGQTFIRGFSTAMHLDRLLRMGVVAGAEDIPAVAPQVEQGSEPNGPGFHGTEFQVSERNGAGLNGSELNGSELNGSGFSEAASPVRKKRILFVTSNGAGMGHLTRLLAVATRLPPHAEPVFASLSTGVDIVERFGIPYEYISSSGAMSMVPGDWNDFAAQRFAQLLDAVEPDVFVFDGTWPYRGMRKAVTGRGIRTVWMRRPMWKADTTTAGLQSSGFFDLVIEPGEFAASYDAGPTTTLQDAQTVSPVTLLSAVETLSREEAREELGYSPEEKVALVTLGAGNINDIGSLQERVLEWFQLHARDWRVVVTKPPIAESDTAHGIETLQVYPLARYTRAFDIAVSACGYNAFHEWLVGELPTLWVPNAATQTDDQSARARWAADNGLGLVLSGDSESEVAASLERLTCAKELEQMRNALRELEKSNGADQAARLIAGAMIGHE